MRRRQIDAGNSRRFAQLICCIAFLVMVGCERAAVSQLPTTKMAIGSKTYTLEIADSESERSKGLMRRDSMPRDHGMIFVFEKEAELSFWMKDTRIPLDIIFISARGEVVSIAQMQPYVERGVPSGRPAKYAIELNAGEIAANGLKTGEQLQIPPEALEPANP